MSEDYRDMDPDNADYWEGFGISLLKGSWIFMVVIVVIVFILDLLGIISLQ